MKWYKICVALFCVIAVFVLHAPQAESSTSMYAIWKPDLIDYPNVWDKATGGSTVGGGLRFRIVIQPECVVLRGWSVDSKTISEVAGHYATQNLPDTITAQPNKTAYDNTTYNWGDPTSSGVILETVDPSTCIACLIPRIITGHRRPERSISRLWIIGGVVWECGSMGVCVILLVLVLVNRG
jgi:hypothetical protein